MEVTIQVEQRMGRDEILLEQLLDEDIENEAAEVGHVPWREGRKNDRRENGGSCEESEMKIELNKSDKMKSRSNKFSR